MKTLQQVEPRIPISSLPFTITNRGSCYITTSTRCVVQDCLANNNKSFGITAFADSLVTGNHICGDGQGGSSAGIYTFSGGGGTRTEANHVRNNTGYGIWAHTNDIVIRNTAGGNTGGDFVPSSGPNFGPVQSPATMTNAWGNIVF